MYKIYDVSDTIDKRIKVEEILNSTVLIFLGFL